MGRFLVTIVLVVAASARPSVADYPGAVLADSPAIYLRLGEASGTVAADSSGNGKDFTYINNPTLGVSGAIGGDTAIELDAAGERAGKAAEAYLNDPGDMSAEIWVRVLVNPLGLSIAQRILQAHKGDLTVTSQPGETTFRMTLPSPGKAASIERG